jgi:hypothetical protein
MDIQKLDTPEAAEKLTALRERLAVLNQFDDEAVALRDEIKSARDAWAEHLGSYWLRKLPSNMLSDERSEVYRFVFDAAENRTSGNDYAAVEKSFIDAADEFAGFMLSQRYDER